MFRSYDMIPRPVVSPTVIGTVIVEPGDATTFGNATVTGGVPVAVAVAEAAIVAVLVGVFVAVAVAAGVFVDVEVAVAATVDVAVGVPQAPPPLRMNGIACGAAAVPVSITAAYVVGVPIVPCTAFDPGAFTCPSMLTGGTNGPDAPVPPNWNSSQYVPAGSVVPTLATVAMIGRVVPVGAVSVARYTPDHADDTNRFVVRSPNTTVLPTAPGVPFHICTRAVLNVLGDVADPV